MAHVSGTSVAISISKLHLMHCCPWVQSTSPWVRSSNQPSNHSHNSLYEPAALTWFNCTSCGLPEAILALLGLPAPLCLCCLPLLNALPLLTLTPRTLPVHSNHSTQAHTAVSLLHPSRPTASIKGTGMRVDVRLLMDRCRHFWKWGCAMPCQPHQEACHPLMDGMHIAVCSAKPSCLNML